MVPSAVSTGLRFAIIRPMRPPDGDRVGKDDALRPPAGQSEWLDGTDETADAFQQACRRTRAALRASALRRAAGRTGVSSASRTFRQNARAAIATRRASRRAAVTDARPRAYSNPAAAFSVNTDAARM